MEVKGFRQYIFRFSCFSLSLFFTLNFYVSSYGLQRNYRFQILCANKSYKLGSRLCIQSVRVPSGTIFKVCGLWSPTMGSWALAKTKLNWHPPKSYTEDKKNNQLSEKDLFLSVLFPLLRLSFAMITVNWVFFFLFCFIYSGYITSSKRRKEKKREKEREKIKQLSFPWMIAPQGSPATSATRCSAKGNSALKYKNL